MVTLGDLFRQGALERFGRTDAHAVHALQVQAHGQLNPTIQCISGVANTDSPKNCPKAVKHVLKRCNKLSWMHASLHASMRHRMQALAAPQLPRRPQHPSRCFPHEHRPLETTRPAVAPPCRWETTARTRRHVSLRLSHARHSVPRRLQRGQANSTTARNGRSRPISRASPQHGPGARKSKKVDHRKAEIRPTLASSALLLPHACPSHPRFPSLMHFVARGEFELSGILSWNSVRIPSRHFGGGRRGGRATLGTRVSRRAVARKSSRSELYSRIAAATRL